MAVLSKVKVQSTRVKYCTNKVKVFTVKYCEPLLVVRLQHHELLREFCESCSGVVQKNKRKVALTCDKSLANPNLAPPLTTARLCTVAAPAAPGCSSCPPAAPRTAAPAGNGSGGRPHEASDRSDTPVRVLTSQSYPASAALASRGGWRLLMLSESLTSLRPTSTGRESDFIAI